MLRSRVATVMQFGVGTVWQVWSQIFFFYITAQVNFTVKAPNCGKTKLKMSSLGPCKNKLGHSRIAIFFNRVQTIGICFGISILMILASPVILLTLPCLLTSKCRMCPCCTNKGQESHVWRQWWTKSNMLCYVLSTNYIYYYYTLLHYGLRKLKPLNG